MNILIFFEREGDKMVSRADRLHDVLTHLRYEGRMSRTKNLRAARDVIKNLEVRLEEHWNFQEKVIFPFIQIRVPRQEAAIHFLEEEHEGIKKYKDNLKRALQRQSESNASLGDGKIYEQGICLISLLHHHLGFEKRHIYRSVRKELRQDEKNEMSKRIAGWVKKQRKGKNGFAAEEADAGSFGRRKSARRNSLNSLRAHCSSRRQSHD